MKVNRWVAAAAVALTSPAVAQTPPATPGDPSSEQTPSAADAVRAPEMTQSGPTMDIETIDLEELLDTPIQSVSRREERASLAPATVFVVSREDIRNHGYRTLSDVLRSMPGFFVTDDSAYAVAGIRGINVPGDLTTRLLILVDGHPVNNSVGIGQSYVSRDFPLNTLGVERVEVIKGPVGSVYGPLAYFGVVNVVTRTAEDGQHAEVSVGGQLAQGAHSAGEVEALYTGKAGGASWVLNLGLWRSNGYTWELPELVGQDREVPEGGIVRDADREWSNSAYGSVKFADLTLTLGWSQRYKNLPTAPYSTIVGDPRNNFYNRTGFAQLAWTRDLTDSFNLYARVAYDDFRYSDDLAYPEPPDDAGMFYDIGLDRWGSAEVRGTWTPFQGHRDMIGVDVQYHDTLQRAQYRALPSAEEDPVNGFGVGDISNQFTTVNAYLLIEQRLLSDRLLLQGGLTFFVHQLFGNRLTPKIAAVYQLTDDDTVKGYYSEGFRPPTMFEAVFEDGLDFIPNADLKPESARTVELSYERRLFGAASVGLSLYHSRFDGIIRSSTVLLDPLGDPEDPENLRQQFLNRGAVAATGADLHFKVLVRDVVQAYGGVAVQTADFGSDPADAANFAPVTANLALSTTALWKPLTLALDASFVSERTKDPNTILIEGDRTTVPAYVLINATARLQVPWVQGLGARLAVYNVFDVNHADPLVGDYAPLSEARHPGRTFRLDLEYRF